MNTLEKKSQDLNDLDTPNWRVVGFIMAAIAVILIMITAFNS